MKNWFKFSASFVSGCAVAVCLATSHQSVSQEPTVKPATAVSGLHGTQPLPDTQDLAPENRLGISHEKPTSGEFVAIADGWFMIPYSTKIPGTDVEFTMIPIRGGTFKMGSPEDEPDRGTEEGPQFEVTVEPFWMGKYEVTWAEYKKYMQLDTIFRLLHEKGKRIQNETNMIDGITAPSSLYDPTFTFAAGEEPTQPAATISQFAAKQYTKWLSLTAEDYYRLPYEAEWEYACRAGTTTAYYFGDDPDELEDHGWFLDNSDEDRHPVGEFPANPWGLYDMYGNVAEWVLDQYNEQGYTHVTGDSVTVEQSYNKPVVLDPRVSRGGTMISEAHECRSASRLASDKEWRSTDPNIPKSPWWYTDEPATGVGFRLVRPLKSATREEQEAVWSADIERIMYEAKNRINDNGRGRFGTADPDLPKDIQALRDDK